MKIVIFIGHFKTGSTSLQSFLSGNYLSLLRAGILYPSVETIGTAHNMSVLRDNRDVPTTGMSLNIVEPHNALALKLKTEEDGHGVPPYYLSLPSGFQMLEMIQNQILSLEPKSMILCSEVFALLGMTETQKSIERIANRFKYGDVTIYCNLRRPDDYLSSWHRQRLKFGAKMDRLAEGGLTEYLDTPHFQQYRLIQGWMDHFPQARLVVRNFDHMNAAGGSVLDFVEQSGITFPKGLSVPKNQNLSVPNALAEIGRRALHELPRADAGELVNKLTTARKHIAYTPDKEVEMFGENNRKILLDRFRPVASELDKLAHSPPFYHHINDLGKVRGVTDITAARQALPSLIASPFFAEFNAQTRKWLQHIDL